MDSAGLSSFPEAKTINLSLAARVRDGNCQNVSGSLGSKESSSVRYQPVRSTGDGPLFSISIQSELSPSSSVRLVELLAINSEMVTFADRLVVRSRIAG